MSIGLKEIIFLWTFTVILRFFPSKKSFYYYHISDFDNHIYVTTDAEAFFFLHDLISSYLKEKERVLNIQQQSAHHKEKLEQADNKDIMNKNDNENNSEYNKNSSATTSKSLKPPVDPLQNDWRLFECNTWHLEPTVIF